LPVMISEVVILYNTCGLALAKPEKGVEDSNSLA